MSTAIRGERERAGGKGVDGQRGGLWRGKQKKKKGKEKTEKEKTREKQKKREKNYFIQFKSYITKHSTAAEELQKSTTANI